MSRFIECNGKHYFALLSLFFSASIALAQTATPAAGETQGRKDASTATSSSSAKGASKISKGDQNILRDLTYSNLAEIETGKIAQSKSQNAEVKKFAQRMIDDHTKSQQEVQKLADSKGVTLPTEPDKKHQAMAKKLSGMSGEEFDKRYMKQGGVGDHQKTHKLLEKAGKKAEDPDLKALVAKTTPIVEEHLKMAQQHSDSLKSSGKSHSAAGAAGK